MAEALTGCYGSGKRLNGSLCAPLIDGAHVLKAVDEALDFLDVGHVAVERGLLLGGNDNGAVLHAEGVSDLLVVSHLLPEGTLKFPKATLVKRHLVLPLVVGFVRLS